MVRLSKIYTKTGDLGETGLGDGSRISKATWRVRAIGAVDETNAAVGISRLDAEGDSDTMREPAWNQILALPGAHLHLYGKAQARRARKMGHVTFVAPTMEQAQAQLAAACAILGIAL